MNQLNNVNQQQQINRGDIYYAELQGGKGSEQQMVRPVIVLQNNMGNRYSPCCTVIPLTSQNKRWIPTHVTLHKTTCLERLSIALAEQVNTISKERFKDYIGVINPSELVEVENALMIQLGIGNTNKLAYA